MLSGKKLGKLISSAVKEQNKREQMASIENMIAFVTKLNILARSYLIVGTSIHTKIMIGMRSISLPFCISSIALSPPIICINKIFSIMTVTND